MDTPGQNVRYGSHLQPDGEKYLVAGVLPRDNTFDPPALPSAAFFGLAPPLGWCSWAPLVSCC